MNNKYQEALDNYSENVDYRDYSTKTVDIVNESYDTLQELVDKETPKKPSFLNYGGYKIGNWHCNNCDSIIHKEEDYCPHCGQKLDWSEENE